MIWIIPARVEENPPVFGYRCPAITRSSFQPSHSASSLITPLLYLAKKSACLSLSPLFEFRLSPLYVIKLCEPSRFILLVQDQKRRGEHFSGRLPAMFHVVFYQSTLLAPSEHHTLGKSARTCVNWCTRAPLQPAVVIPFFECFFSPLRTHLKFISQLRNWTRRTLGREKVDGSHIYVTAGLRW